MLTIGVEEEFLLVDPHTGENAPVSRLVLDRLPAEVEPQSRLEFRRSMVEMVTTVCTDIGDLHDQLRRHRAAVAQAASAVGARVLAVGATPVAEPDRRVADDPRFEAIARHYGPIAHDPAVCGSHVHVGVPERSLAIEVCNHLRGWLPILQGLAANSPLYLGADTGHASWRSLQLQRWPSVGPSPLVGSAGEYDEIVSAHVASTAMLDPSMVLWYARPSTSYPTVEVRVSDVGLTTGDTVVVAALVRALVATILDDIAAGRSAPPIPDHLLHVAHWSAAHHGLDGPLLDPRTGQARPAWDLVDELVHTVAEALHQHGDLPVVDKELARLREHGTGANRQRHILHSAGSVPGAVATLAELTSAG